MTHALYNTVFPVCALLAWIAFGYRVRWLRAAPNDVALWGMCVSIACPATAFVAATPAVYRWLDAQTGVANLASLLVYSCIVGHVAGAQVMLLYWTCSPARAQARAVRRLLMLAGVLVAMAVLFARARVGDERPMDFDAHYATEPYAAAFLGVYLMTFAVGLANTAVLCWRYATITTRSSLGRGLRLITIGAMCAEGYCLGKIASVSGRWVGANLDLWNTTIAPASVSVGAMLLAAGLTLPAWAPRVDAALGWVRLYRAYRQLYPLWRALCSHTPVVFEAEGLPPARKSAVRDLGFLLYRRVIEIEDARLYLRHYENPDVVVEAAQRAERAGLSGAELSAAVEAARLRAALKARQSEDPALDQAGEEVGSVAAAPGADHATHADTHEMAEWLVRVARAWCRCPLVAEVL